MPIDRAWRGTYLWAVVDGTTGRLMVTDNRPQVYVKPKWARQMTLDGEKVVRVEVFYESRDRTPPKGGNAAKVAKRPKAVRGGHRRKA